MDGHRHPNPGTLTTHTRKYQILLNLIFMIHGTVNLKSFHLLGIWGYGGTLIYIKWVFTDTILIFFTELGTMNSSVIHMTNVDH